MELDFNNLPFCGREEELKVLERALDTITGHKRGNATTATARSHTAGAAPNDTVFVGGASGTGKSELVSHFIAQSVTPKGIWCCRSKYDAIDDHSSTPTRPYAVIADCFSQLVQLLLDDDCANNNRKWSQKLQEDHHEVNYAILIPLIPNVVELLPKEETSSSSSIKQQANNKLLDADWRSFHNMDRHVICLRALLRHVCSERPVVIVYDDLQWADQQSLLLKQRLGFAAGTSAEQDNGMAFLTIATHRPLPEGHPMRLVLEKQENQNSDTIIYLKEFGEDIIVKMLQGLFQQHESTKEMHMFATLILRKTGGNPCAIHEYLKILQERSFLEYCMLTYRWKWVDLETIELETDVADDIVQLVLRKIGSLVDTGLQQVLLHAAVLRNSRFDARVLFHAMQYSTNNVDNNDYDGADESKNDGMISSFGDMKSILTLGCEEGLFLHRPDSDLYKFSHDRVLEAAQTFIPQDEAAREYLHFNVGRQLLKIVREKNDWDTSLVDSIQVSDILMMAMTHLSIVSEMTLALRLSHEDRLEFSHFNRLAADAAFEAASYHYAILFLEAGLKLLDSSNNTPCSKWVEHYELTLGLSDSLAYAYYCTGEVEKSEILIDEVLANAKSLDDKLSVHQTRILSRWQHHDLDGSLQAALLVVQDVANITFPKRWLKLHLIRQVLQIKSELSKITSERLLDLPEISDDKVHTSLRFLDLLTSVANFCGKEELFLLAMIESIKLTLRHGYGKESPVSIGFMGGLLSMLGDLDDGYRVAKASVDFLAKKKFPLTEARAAVIMYAYPLHWKMPLQDCLAPLLDAGRTLMHYGDTRYLFFSCFTYCLSYYYCGLDLKPLAVDYVKFEEVLSDYGQHMFLAMFRCRQQQIQNLMGKTSGDPTNLTGSAMNQDECITEWTRTGHNRALLTMYLCRMELAYYFDNDKVAEEMSSRLAPIITEGPGVWLPTRVLFDGLICFRLARQKRKRSYIRQGKRHLKFLKAKVAAGCVNCHHRLMLLSAEYNGVKSKTSEDLKVQKGYDEAIVAAGKLGFLQDQALGNELAGRYFLEVQKDEEWSRTYLERAVDLYDQWGAQGKADSMRVKYRGILAGSTTAMSRNSGASSRARLSIPRLGFLSSRSSSTEEKRLNGSDRVKLA